MSKILLLPGAPGTSHDNIAREISGRLAGHYDFLTEYTDHIVSNPALMKGLTEDADAAVFFNWNAFTGMSGHVNTETKTIVAVYDTVSVEFEIHRYLEQVCSMVMASNSELLDKIGKLAVPLLPCRDGVDTTRFSPRPRPVGGRLRVGWVGNSQIHLGSIQSGDPEKNGWLEDWKGYEAIIVPLAESMPGINWRILDKSRTPRPYAKMPAWYADIDVLLCASKGEGTPMPVLEAMACGIPVITTNVGIVPEVVKTGELENGIVVERSVDAFREAVLALDKDRERLLVMGERAREAVLIGGWDWSNRIHQFEDAFQSLNLGCLAEKHAEERIAPARAAIKRRRIAREARGKPKALLICDVPGWAFDVNMRDMAAYLGDRFDFDFWYVVNYKPDQPDNPLPDLGAYDVIYNLYHRWPINHLLPWDRTVGSLRARWFVPETPGPATQADVDLVNEHRAFHVVTRENYDEIEGRCPNLFYLTNPVNMRRFPEPAAVKDCVVACWNGNARHYNAMWQDVKGFHPIIQPACRKAGVDLEFAEYNTNRLSPAEMPAFYQKANVTLSASLYEGSSNSVMEGMASGHAVISTPVGNILEMRDSQVEHLGASGIIIVERSVEAFAEALEGLKADPARVIEMGELNRREIAARWSWEAWADRYAEFLMKGVGA